MRMQADLHVHTTASGHGYSTIKEIADEAGLKGLKMIAITDHGLQMPGAPHWYHFTNMISLPRVINGVELLRGVEADILDCQGNIDMSDEIIHDYLDIVLAGFHDSTGYSGTTLEENTEAMIAAIKNPNIHIITHPGNPKYPVDVEKVVIAAKEYNKVIELNNQSFVCRPNSFPNCNKFARMARKHDALVAINSDAHICYNIGNHEVALAMAQKAGIRKSQIINTSPEKVWEYLNWHKQQSVSLKRAQ